MQPTREQVIKWAAEANILQSIDLLESNQWRQDLIRELERFAGNAYAAGVAKGINLAGEAHIEEHGYDKYGFAAAIQSLKGKQ